MRCLNCGSHNHLPHARFCGHCGNSLSASTCALCGWLLDSAHKFCPGCGASATGTSKSAEPPRPPISYIPNHLVEQILTERARIEGERKHATVLFADVVNSTRLTYGKDPETANAVLGRVIEVMRRAVFRFEGYVKPLGDGIEALFGVPVAQEDHAVRGCLAALELVAGIEHLNGAEDNDPIQVRVGLNSGEVVVKRISDDLLLELDAVGATVALASRLEGLAAPNTVLVTAATLSLAQRVVRASSRGKAEIRGISDPVEVFQLDGVWQTPVRFRRPADGGVTSFVGRVLELDILSYAWLEASRGEGQVVAFVGEPGIGKSRLVAEFIRSNRLKDALVLEARSVSYGKATPYLPIINLLRAYFDIHTGDHPQRAKGKIDSELQKLGAVPTAHRTAVLDLLGLHVDDESWRNYDPSERRRKLQEAVVDILLREVRVRALCLVFEDLHWVDGETQALLDKLVDFIPTRSILLLVNYRPEYVPGWGRRTYFRQLPIASLPAATAQQLLDDLLGVRADLAPLKARLIEQTAGNPLFLEECVHMLRAEEILHGTRGDARLARPLDQIDFLPASVQATLKARIDRLDAQQKHVLDFASAFGKDFSYPNLKAAIDIDDMTLQTRLEELQALEFIHQIRRLPEPEFTFKHALTYQVAYRSLLSDRRRAMHAAILRSMEQRHREYTIDHVEELARHALQAGEWDSALRYTFEAGKKAFDRSAHKETVQHSEEALKALHMVGDLPGNRQLAVELRFLLRYALLNLGEVERVGQLLAETRPLIQALDVPQRTAQFEAFESNYHCLTNDQAKAVEHGLRALEIAEKEGDRALRVEMAFRLAQPYYQLARYRDAIELLEAGLKLIGPDEACSRFGMSALPAVVCHTWLTLCHAELGAFTRAADHASAAVALVTKTEHPLSMAFAYWGQGHLYLYRRDYQEAVSALQKGLDVSQRWSLPFWLSRLSSALGLARALDGETDAGVALIEHAVTEAETMHVAVDAPRLFERLGAAHLLAGRHVLAESKARQALTLATRSDARGHQAWALRLLGEIRLASEPFDAQAAEELFDGALTLALSLGMRPLAVLCYEGLSRLHTKCGQHRLGEEALRQAHALWSDLGG